MSEPVLVTVVERATLTVAMAARGPAGPQGPPGEPAPPDAVRLNLTDNLLPDLHLAVVDTLPASPDPDTLYFIREPAP